MIKAAGFVCGAQAEQPAYNSSPITKGALFTAMKPGEGQPPEKLTEEEKELVENNGCAVVENKPGLSPEIMRNMYKRVFAYLVFLPVVLFGASGRMDWVNAWVYVAFIIVLMLAYTASLARNSPDLIMERMQSPWKKDIKPWDKALAPLVAVVMPVSIMLVSAVEMRYHWPPQVTPWLSGAAFCAYLAGFLFSHWAMLENRYFSAVVRIQTDRGHKVVDTGPYAYIRHPGYTGAMVYLLALPLALGSYWGLIPAVTTCVLLIIRTSLEDSTLVKELDGYREYTSKVRYRLIPGVW